MKPVLLVFPGEKTRQPLIPLSVLVLAAYLREHGVDVEVLDTRISPYDSVDFGKYLLVGMSVTIGERLVHAYKISKYIRNNYPKTLIVWGGQLPTFSPETVCHSEFVDVAVRKEGEESLLEVAMCVSVGKPFDDVKGITFKKGDRIVSNPDRQFIDMNIIPVASYDIISLKDYTEQTDGTNRISIETSRGCPHDCAYCFSPQMYNKVWRAKDAKKVAEELSFLVGKFSVNNFTFWDSNFFVDKKRVLDLCSHIKRMELEIYWSAYTRADYFAGYTDEEISLMKESGLCFLTMGAESGSQRILDLMEKKIKVSDIKTTVSKCARHGIGCALSFMTGIAGETFEDVKETIKLCNELERINPNAELKGYHLFELIPGTRLYSQYYTDTFNTLEEYMNFNTLNRDRFRWLSLSEEKIIKTVSQVSFFLYMRKLFAKRRIGFKKSILGSGRNMFLWKCLSPLIYLDAKLRWKTYFFGMGYEWHFFGYVANKILKRRVGEF